MRKERKTTDFLYQMLYVATAAAVLFPVCSSRLVDGGSMAEWAIRIEEIYVGGFRLFPTAEVFAALGEWKHVMNSNLWFWFPVLLYRLTGSLTAAYRVFLSLLQLLTLLSALLFFQSAAGSGGEKAGDDPAVCLGVALYMTCPYRILVCYDWEDLSQAVVWMLLPLYGWAVIKLLNLKENRYGVWISLAAAALAGIGYADAVSFLSLAGITFLAALWWKRVRPLLAVGVGALLFAPGLWYLLEYLFSDGFAYGAQAVSSIMGRGCRIGQLFTSYAFRDGHPGMGLGMMLCLVTGLWLRLVCGIKGEGEGRGERFLAGLSLLLFGMSWRYFPWDVVQRMGNWSLKLVSLVGTPVFFAGLGYAVLCVPAARAAARIGRYEDRTVARAVPLILWIACVGLCIYLCAGQIAGRG